MKEFEAKTVEEAVEKACSELNVSKEELKYQVLSEQKGLFKKSVKIGVLEIRDVQSYIYNYLDGVLETLGLKADIEIYEKDGINKVDMDSDYDASRIIGRNGETLRALNELVRAAVFTKFNEHYHILLNVNGYKNQKYAKLEGLAKRIAKTVIRTKMSVELQPMTSDERRIIHNVLSNYPNIKTASIGGGKDRHITIQYVPGEGEDVTPEIDEEPSFDLDKAFEEKENELNSTSEE